MKYIIKISDMCETCPHFKLDQQGGTVDINLKCTYKGKYCVHGLKEIGTVQTVDFTDTVLTSIVYKR